MVFCNNYEIDQRLCRNLLLFKGLPASTHENTRDCSKSFVACLLDDEADLCKSSLAGRTWKIWRSSFFVMMQAVAIHPAITLLIEEWPARKEKEQ